MMWDFWSLSPESLHQVTILFSDRGTPDGYRHMNGYSSHTFSLINGNNELFYVSGTSRPNRVSRTSPASTPTRCGGRTRIMLNAISSHAIEDGNLPKWRVCVQIMPEKEARHLSHKSL